MQDTIRALVFDFGGVLINWEPRRVFQKFFHQDPQAMEAFMQEIGFSEWNRQQDAGYPFKQAVIDLSTRFPQYARIIQAYDVDWEESITGIVPGTVELVRKLKEKGFPLYGLTNWNLDKFSLVRRKYDFLDLFDEIIVSGEIRMAKPDPEIYHFLLDRIHRLPGECLMIDDSLANIETARKIGFPTIHFSSAERLEKELLNLNIL